MQCLQWPKCSIRNNAVSTVTQIWYWKQWSVYCDPNVILETMQYLLCLFVSFVVTASYQQYFSFILAVIWCMKWGDEPEPTLLAIQVNFNSPYHIGMAWEELTFADAVTYTQRQNGLQHVQLIITAVARFVPVSPGSPTQCLNQLSHLPTPMSTVSQK